MRHRKTSLRRIRQIVLCFATLPVAMPAMAQDDPTGRDIDEIIVTATKREQSVQEVPIAVTAITGEDLKDRGISELTDLMTISPSLSVYDAQNSTNAGAIRIRGMGTSGNNPGLESAVGAYIDGVYRSRSGLAFQDLVDVERVEVLRGPQGTLFGKNTSAGLVHILTKKPDMENTGGHLKATIGNLEQYKVQGSLTGPLIEDELAGRIAFSWNQRDGYYDQINGNGEFADRDRWTIKAQLLWAPTEDFDTRIIVDYAKHDEMCCPAVVHTAGPTAPAAAAFGAIFDVISGKTGTEHDVGTNHDPLEKFSDWGIQVESNWQLGEVTLSSIIAYREFDITERFEDIDFTSADILQPQDDDEETWENFSFELRAIGTYEPLDLDWLLGAYVYTEDLENQSELRFGTVGGAYFDSLVGTTPFLAGVVTDGVGRNSNFTQETQGAAIFSHNTFHLTEELSLVIGARYGWEEKDVKGTINGARVGEIANEPWCAQLAGPTSALGGALLPLRAQLNFFCDNLSFDRSFTNTELTGTIKLTYAFDDDVNSYLSYSRGFKAGGFKVDANAHNCILPAVQPASASPGQVTTSDGVICSPLDNVKFDPEFSNNFELGLKARLLGGALRVNSAFFVTIFKGFQLNTFTGVALEISNLPRVQSWGLEMESTYFPMDWLMLSLNATYADTRYGKNLFSEANAPLEGNRLTHAPAWTGNFSWRMDRDLTEGWQGFISGVLAYQGRQNAGSALDPAAVQDDYYKVNARIGIFSEDGTWEFALFGTNLTDEITSGLIFPSPIQAGGLTAFQSAPRLYGVEVIYNFGGGS